ncbi:MAG: hypothetical protein R6V39_00980 [Desulfovibrionales bacterium]
MNSTLTPYVRKDAAAVKVLPARGLQGDLGQKFPVAHKVAGLVHRAGTKGGMHS